MNKTCVLNETVSLMALGSGIWEYYNITCKEDLIEAYRDFDERIAHNTQVLFIFFYLQLSFYFYYSSYSEFLYISIFMYIFLISRYRYKKLLKLEY